MERGQATDIGRVTIRFSEDDVGALRQEATATHATVSEVVRQAVRAHLVRQAAIRAVPAIDAAVGQHIDRLAALIAKTFVAADMANWQAHALCHALLRHIHPERIMAEARQRALIDLRRAGLDIGESSELYAPRA